MVSLPSVQRFLDKTVAGGAAGPVSRDEIYRDLRFPRGVDVPVARPYTAINMVSTVDGKVAIGGPGTTRLIGSPTDHLLMARIELQADAVLLGAGLVRQDDPPYPTLTPDQRAQRTAMGLRPDPLWAVVSTRGELEPLPRVFAGPREHTALFCGRAIASERRRALEQHTQLFVAETERVDAHWLGRVLREQLGVGSMICLGGPTLNATLVEAGAADELFLTLAPKLQGGSHRPTVLEGHGFPPEHLLPLELLSLYGDGDELYLRYRLSAS